MFKTKSLVVYKNKPAIVTECGEKITIILNDKSSVRVREKDIELLHPGPVENFNSVESAFSAEAAHELWELLAGENTTFNLETIAAFADGGFSPKNAWSTYLLVKDALFFEGDINTIKAKNAGDVAAEEAKRAAKHGEEAARTEFLQRLKQQKINLPDDLAFLQDVVSLALGKSEKSKTLREADFSETSEAAHKLLLETGAWDAFINPYPSRYGVSLKPCETEIAPPPDEERVDLTGLAAWAIDDEGSADPDDAVSLESTPDGIFLYVHVADPASSVKAGSPADIDARAHGATFYAPEGAVRMLNEQALPLFALGLTETSPALSFKLKLADGILDEENPNIPSNFIEKTEIFPSKVKVSRISYREADGKNELSGLFALAECNIRRRLAYGAAQIDFPEVKISVKDGKIDIIPEINYKSRALVRECMLLTGEGAATWALQRHLAFPFICQEAENTENAIPSGYAGAYQLRRTMRPRILTTKPGLHQGLGLDIYTQVTSPLRRYTDILAHQQIRAYLSSEKINDMAKIPAETGHTPDSAYPAPLGEDELLARLAAAERAALATTRAERASRAHWTCVYLSDKIGMEQEGIVLDRRGSHIVVLLPALGLETQTALPHGSSLEPNDAVIVKLASVKIPECEMRWNVG
jgi:exoribonuclease-2